MSPAGPSFPAKFAKRGTMPKNRFDVDRAISIKLEESRAMLNISHFAVQQCTLGLRQATLLLRTTEQRIQDSQALLNGRLRPNGKAFSWWPPDGEDGSVLPGLG